MVSSDGESNFLNDTFNSAKELITERFSSPFIFSYLISWMAIHYEVVILAFTDSSSDLKIYDKLDLIQTHINNTYFGVPFLDFIQLNGFTWSLIVACFYTFAYPFLDYRITKFTLNRKVAIRNLRVQAENNLVFSADDVNKIYLKHAKTEADLKSRIENSELNENQLRAQLDNLQNQIKLEKDKEKERNAVTKQSIREKLVNMEPITIGKKTNSGKDEKAKISEENYVLKTHQEIESTVNEMNKSVLLAIKAIGKVERDNKIGLEDDGVLPGLLNVSTVLMGKNPNIFKVTTNPKTLNKVYKLSELGNQIYAYLTA